MENYTKEQVLHAIDNSIKYWKGIVHKNQRCKGCEGCDLCMLFNTDAIYKDPNATSCNSCPVYIMTGSRYCDDTPYKATQYYESTIAHKNFELSFLYEVRL